MFDVQACSGDSNAISSLLETYLGEPPDGKWVYDDRDASSIWNMPRQCKTADTAIPYWARKKAGYEERVAIMRAVLEANVDLTSPDDVDFLLALATTEWDAAWKDFDQWSCTVLSSKVVPIKKSQRRIATRKKRSLKKRSS